LSDIRAVGAPAFRLNASFRSLNNSTDIGNYSEVWVSRGQWRRDTELNGFRRLEVAGPTKKWLLENQTASPPEIDVVVKVLRQVDMPKQFKIKEINNRDLGGVTARCVKSESKWTTDIYCVDPKSGALLFKESLYHHPETTHESYFYGYYGKFGNHLFPQSIRYKREGDLEAEIRVLEMSDVSSSADPSLFSPITGATETANCSVGTMTPPQEKFAPDPNFPDGERTKRAVVVLGVVVGIDGKTHEIKVVRSGGAKFDAEAIRSIQRWRFKPASCLEEPMAANVNVEVEFRRQ
jgi:TonB family protein